MNIRKMTIGAVMVLAACATMTAENSPPVTLKQAYAGAFLIGTVMGKPPAREAEWHLLCRQFNSITAGNCLKPKPVHPAEDRYEFATADVVVKMAHEQGLVIQGHTLIWHSQCPDWFFRDGDKPAGRELVLKRMRDHIATVVGRYAGKIQGWDVVNEVIDSGKGYLRETKWLAAMGEDYIAEAFRAAHRADPRAKLYYNDFSIERPAKREKALRLIRELKSKGVPMDGIGIQGHWELDKIPYQDIEDAIIAFHKEGVDVAITELDLDVVPRRVTGAEVDAREAAGADPYPNGLPAAMLQRQADQYGKLFAIFYKHRDKISRVTIWGLHDGVSWLNTWPSKRTNHPLLWDRDLNPKPALAAVLAVPVAAAQRGGGMNES